MRTTSTLNPSKKEKEKKMAPIEIIAKSPKIQHDSVEVGKMFSFYIFAAVVVYTVENSS